MMAPAANAIGGPLRQSDYEKLSRESGLRREYIDGAGLTRVSHLDGRDAIGYKGGDCEGILIPYYLPGETAPREFCLRRDHPDIENGKPKGKYLFPPGRGNLLYFPPGVIPEHLADTSLPILLTEGAKKTLALQQTAWDGLGDTAEKPRYVAIGISGVWNWRGTIGKITGPDGSREDEKGVIPDFARIEWRNRKITIIFDTNVISNPSVRAARDQLTKELRKRGAKVFWFTWPSTTKPTVNGIDDLLALEGPTRILELIEAAKPFRQAGPELRVWNLTEMRHARFEPPTAIAEGFLNAGETIGLIGRPKAGKSRLVQQLAADLSRGRDFLGHAVSRPHRVLLVDLENRPAMVQARLNKMSHSGPGDENVFIYAPETLFGNAINLGTAEGSRCLERIVDECSPDVVVIDPWRLALGGDENKPEPVVKALTALSRLREKSPKLAIVIIHHLKKQQGGENRAELRIDPYGWVEAASGSYSFVGHVDGCFGLERQARDGEEQIIFGGTSRNCEPRTLLLDDDPDTLRFTVAEGEAAALKLFTPKEAEFWHAMRCIQEFTFKGAMDYLGTTNRKTVRSMLKKAMSVRVIEQGLDKVYRQKGPEKRN